MSISDETPLETPREGRGGTGADADPRVFLISAFPGSGADRLLAALAPARGLHVLPPLDLAPRRRQAAPAPEPGVDPSLGAGGRVVAQDWRPRAGTEGLVLVRNPFQVLAELSASVAAESEAAAPRARGGLLDAIAQALFDEDAAGLAPDAETFAGLLAGLWARHARALLASGLPVLQCERLAAAPEHWAAHIASLAGNGTPLPATDGAALILPPASLRAEGTMVALSEAQVSAIRLIAGDAMQACGYALQDGALVVTPGAPPPAPPPVDEAERPLKAQLQAQRAAFDVLSAQVLRALEAGRRRERTFDTMGQVVSDLCRQQEASFKKSQREISDLAMEVIEARQSLERMQSRAAQLQRELAAIRDCYLTLADLGVAPPTAKFVRLGDDVIEVGRTKNTLAKISLSLPSAQDSSWIAFLSVTVADAGGSPLPPLAISYASGTRNRRLKQPVAVGDNHLMFILSRVNGNATVNILIEPRAAPYRIQDLALLPLTSASGLAGPADDEATPPAPADEDSAADPPLADAVTAPARDDPAGAGERD